jgi:hypothetical protein
MSLPRIARSSGWLIEWLVFVFVYGPHVDFLGGQRRCSRPMASVGGSASWWWCPMIGGVSPRIASWAIITDTRLLTSRLLAAKIFIWQQIDLRTARITITLQSALQAVIVKQRRPKSRFINIAVAELPARYSPRMPDFTEKLQPASPTGPDTLSFERNRSDVPIDELSQHLLSRNDFLQRQARILPILQEDPLFNKLKQANLSNTESSGEEVSRLSRSWNCLRTQLYRTAIVTARAMMRRACIMIAARTAVRLP